MSRRIVRRYASPFPSYTVDYPRPFNVTLLRARDWLPLAFVFAWNPSGTTWDVAFGLAGVWFIVSLLRRMLSRERWCEEHGHDPYQPVLEVPEWRCWYCDKPLGDLRDRRIGELVSDAATSAMAEREAPQARWSNRR